MKRIIKLSLLLLALLLPATATAYDFEVDGIYYNINGNNAIVTYQQYVNYSYQSDYSGDVTIPETVTYNGTTYSVTSIGSSAFQGCSGLTSVNIPNSVTSIGEGAFRGCSGLTSVNIPNSVTTIGSFAFQGCSGLTSVTIPNSVTSISEGTFSNCSGLTSVTIPNSVTSIGSSAFYGCSGLTSIDIPNSVTTIGDYAFYNCSGLTSVNIPNSVTTICSSAFRGCSGLTSIDIPNSVTSIGNSAFNGCSGLTSIDIPNSVTTIGREAFMGCSGLTGNLTIPNSVTTIGDGTFNSCSGLTSIDIPNSVTSIGSSAFRYCSGLTSVTIGNSVTTIGEYAFDNCRNIRTLLFNAVNCTSIGYRAFFGNIISNLQFGENVEHIPAGMPGFNMNGKNLVLPHSVKTIEAGALNGNCDAVVIGNGIEDIAPGAFGNNICVAYASSAEPRPCQAGAFANPQTLYVPAGSKNKYFTAPGWSEFANIIEGEYVRTDSILLSQTTAVLPKGATLQLNANFVPDNASATAAEWLSNNPNIATVDANGLVTAIAVGETDVVAFVDNVTATCHVTVTPVLVESLTLSDNHLSMALDETYTLIADITPDNAENKALEWEIPDNDVIVAQVVNNNRLNISAEGEGTVTITVRSTDGSDLSATCEVFVSATTPVKTLTLTPESLDLFVNDTWRLNASVTPQDAYNKDLRWMSSNTNVATVDGNGIVTARGVGNATITVMTTDGSNLSATCAVTVTNVPVESITLNLTELEMNPGGTYTLNASVQPSYAFNQTLDWVSSNPNVATVTNNGRVTAVGVGSTIVMAMATDGSNVSAACRVTVNSQSASNCFVVANAEMLQGDTIVIPVALTNTQSIVAFQTDIYLPEGFTIVTDEDDEYVIYGSSRLTSDHVIMADNANNGSVRVICYNPAEQPISGNEGDLFYMTIRVPDDASGDYAVNLRNNLLTNTDYQELAIPDAGAVLTVKTFMPGDVNDSRTVNVTDIVVTAMYVLDKNPSPFVFEAADMNGDGNVTVTDIMLIAYLINHPTMNAPKRMPALMDGNDRMSGEGVSLMAGQTRTVSIELDNEMDYTAFQMDLTLPDGLTASNFQLTDRAGSHAFDVSTLSNGDIRALCYSPAIEVIDGHGGALLTFDVTATDAIEGDITVDGIELVTTDCQTVLLNGFAIGVNTTTSVNEVANGKTVARVDYFNLAGQRIDRPESGVTLVVTTYTDGTRTTAKLHRK